MLSSSSRLMWTRMKRLRRSTRLHACQPSSSSRTKPSWTKSLEPTKSPSRKCWTSTSNPPDDLRRNSFLCCSRLLANYKAALKPRCRPRAVAFKERLLVNRLSRVCGFLPHNALSCFCLFFFVRRYSLPSDFSPLGSHYVLLS